MIRNNFLENIGREGMKVGWGLDSEIVDERKVGYENTAFLYMACGWHSLPFFRC